MQMILGIAVLAVPMLVMLTVLVSLGWIVLAVLASLSWVGKRLFCATERVVRNA
jgi:type IV secretory pathway VirB3-like protein